MWLILAFCSAFLLGIYDINKKKSLRENAVIPVLTLNTLFGSLIFLIPIILSTFSDLLDKNDNFHVPSVSMNDHLLIVLKSAIVLSSWLFAYFATKHLPLTIVGPIKATQPVMTLLGALLIFREQLNIYQWLGVLLAIASIFLLSLSSKKEGVYFSQNKWVFFLFLSALTGSASGLYDKFLLQSIPRLAVQSWYNIYQLLMMIPIFLFLWYPNRKNTTPFVWRWNIPLIALFLSLADYVYFLALSDSQSMISIISMIRRSSVVVTFLAGAMMFGEKNISRKSFDLLLIIISMILLYFGTK